MSKYNKMSSTETKTKKGSSLDMNKVLRLNNLTYSAIGDVSPVQSRITRKFYPENNEYTSGQTMAWNLDIGSMMCHGPNSYINFTVKATMTTADTAGVCSPAWTRGKGSAMNLFNQCSIRKNEIIEEQEHVNLLNYYRTLYKHQETELFDSTMSAEGFVAVDESAPTNLMAYDLTGAGVEVSIPLNRFLGFFDNHSQLIPGILLSGSRLQMRLEQATNALRPHVISTGVIGNGDGNYTFTINDPVIYLDLFNLTDSARLEVSKMASKSKGLTYSFTSHFNQTVPVTSSHTQVQVGIPVSHALGVASVVRRTANLTSQTDSTWVAEPLTGNESYRYLLGSVSYPEEKSDSTVQHYIHAQKHMTGSLKGQIKNDVSRTDFTNDMAIYAQSLERSHLQMLSGIQLSGNRVLQIDYTKTDFSAPLQIDAYLHHVRAVNVFANGKVDISY